jgi:hypothetical protein
MPRYLLSPWSPSDVWSMPFLNSSKPSRTSSTTSGSHPKTHTPVASVITRGTAVARVMMPGPVLQPDFWFDHAALVDRSWPESRRGNARILAGGSRALELDLQGVANRLRAYFRAPSAPQIDNVRSSLAVR